jgi:D-alanyl-D-alanine carboxypeptidase
MVVESRVTATVRAGLAIAATGLVLVSGFAGFGPVGAAAATPGIRAAGPGPNTPGSGEQQPSSAEAAADAAARALRQASAAVSSAELTLAQSSAAAGTALESYRLAALTQQTARLDRARADAALQQATQALADQRSRLGRWAVRAYTQGNKLATNPTLSTLLDGQPVDAARQLDWLQVVGVDQTRVIDSYAAAQRAQLDAAAAAATAAGAADTAAATALTAKQQRDAAVAAQQQVVTRLRGDLATAAGKVAAVPGQSVPGRNVASGPVGTCAGGDTSLYPNGEIPLTVLCPLWQAPGKYLRADAAFAFDRLSAAYFQAFGAPICVTDAYRTYAEQVAVYAAHPELAARPGTSNHGWGTATDLCGGIEAFDTTQHAWLMLNGPTFGWFHPAWAEPSGSKPEAWHWEFGG